LEGCRGNAGNTSLHGLPKNVREVYKKYIQVQVAHVKVVWIWAKLT